jgi:hypothetical protein
MLTMAESGFRLTCIQDSKTGDIKLYSRKGDDSSYYHGIFSDWKDQNAMDEILESIEMRCNELGIQFRRPYARSLVKEYTF